MRTDIQLPGFFAQPDTFQIIVPDSGQASLVVDVSGELPGLPV